MQLDPKYFIPFIFVAAVIAALIITFFTISSRKGQVEDFRTRMVEQDSLKYQYMPLISHSDSLNVDAFRGDFVVLDFWATWTEFSQDSHRQLAGVKQQYGDTLQVIAAVVQDREEKVKDYIQKHAYPFSYVNGTRVFNRFSVPGVPTQLVYNPEGRLISIFTGFPDSTQYDSLKKLLD